MKDLFIRRLNEEKSALENVNKVLESSNKSYEKRQKLLKMAQATGNVRAEQFYRGKIENLQDKTAAQLAKKQDIQETLKMMQDDPTVRNRLVGVIAGITAAADMAGAGFAAYQRGKTLTEVNLAAQSAPASRFARSMASGDLGALATIASPEDIQKIIAAGGTGAPIGMGISKILGKVGGLAGTGALMGGLPGAIIGGLGGAAFSAGDIMDLFTGGPERQAAESQQTQATALRQQNFVTDILAQDLMSNASSRQAAALRLGGRGGVINAMVGGMGLGTSEQSIANMMSLEQAVGLPGAQSMSRSMFGLQRGRTGVPISNQSAVNMLGGLSFGIGGPAGANQAAERMLTKVFENGFRNARVGEEIGTVIGAVMQQSDRVTTDNAVNTALSSLNAVNRFVTGRDMDVMSAQHIKGGLNFGEQIFHRAGPFEAMRLATARSLVGNTGFGKSRIGEYMVSALSQMSNLDVLRGNTAPLTELGMGADQATGLLKQFRNQQAAGTLRMLFHGAPGAIGKVLNAPDVFSGFAGLRPTEALQAKRMLMTRLNQTGITGEDAQQYVDFLMGITGQHGDKTKKAIPSKYGQNIESAALTEQTMVQLKEMGAEAHDKKILDSIKHMNDGFSNMMEIWKASTDPMQKYTEYLITMKELYEGASPAKVKEDIVKWRSDMEVAAKRQRATEKQVEDWKQHQDMPRSIP